MRLDVSNFRPMALMSCIYKWLMDIIGRSGMPYEHSSNPASLKPTECDVQAIVQAVRILAFDDPAVAAMASHEFKYIVRRSVQTNLTPESLSTYFSSSPDTRTEK